MDRDALSAQWIAQSRAYVSAVNAYVARGDAEGWDDAGPQPDDPRGPLADPVLAEVVAANAEGRWKELRARLPPAHEPFVPRLQKQAIGLSGGWWIDERHVLAQVGTPWRPVGIGRFGLDGSFELLPGVTAVTGSDVGFARVVGGAVEVADRYDGPARWRVALPAGEDPVEELHLFPDGDSVLIVRADGIFRATPDGTRRMLPEEDDGGGADEDQDDRVQLSMVHAAISPDGMWVALGHQDSQHLVLTPDGVVVAQFGPVHSSYPHHAAFSPDEEWAIFNACHFYNGVTVAVSRDDLPGLDLEEYKDDPRLRVLEGGSRVYASAFLDGAFLLGNAYGYVYAVRPDGTLVWRHFCGSSIGGIAISPDRRHAAVTTAAGYLQLLELDAPERDPFQIGSSPHREVLRFVQWQGLPMLRW